MYIVGYQNIRDAVNILFSISCKKIKDIFNLFKAFVVYEKVIANCYVKSFGTVDTSVSASMAEPMEFLASIPKDAASILQGSIDALVE